MHDLIAAVAALCHGWIDGRARWSSTRRPRAHEELDYHVKAG